MKFTLSWLSNFVDLNGIDAAQLADKLTMLGLEVDAVEELFTELDAIITCKVVEVGKHPNADKLSLCKVDTGQGEPVEVVCGAPNVTAGMVTALAQPGVRLPDGTKIKKAKVRGQVSLGMLCSARELGLSEDHSGIMELDRDLSPGLPLATTLKLRDTVIEVDLTPNRPDCASVMGIAREVAGFTNQKMHLPVTNITPLTGEQLDYAVSIHDADLCPRYTARKIKNVTIGPSPLWMQQQLTAVGMRPINNIVDITNYVMLELGQPLHAFDFNTLRGKEIIVRRPAEGEKQFVTLDNQTRTLEPDMLMICDGEGPVAVAGVMGGLDSEVTEKTTDILLESACFSPVSIRRTARRLNIPSEASYRFERGVDPDLADKAMERAISLMEEYCGGTAEETGIDVYPGKKALTNLELRAGRVRSLLGVDTTKEQMAAHLRSIGFDVTVDDSDTLQVTVPSFRIDIEREVDLIEEIARLVGYNEIPTTQPTITMDYPKRDSLRVQRASLSKVLTAQGFYEAINYSFVSEKHLDQCSIAADDLRRKTTRLLNPLTEDQSVMRSMLLPGLLENIRRNINFQQPDIRLFEIGKVFVASDAAEEQPTEKNQLCMVISGKRYPESESLYFSDKESDFFDIRGAVEHIIRSLRYTGKEGPLSFSPSTEETLEPYCDNCCSLDICDGDVVLGKVGQVKAATLDAFSIKQAVYFAEIDLDGLNQLPVVEKHFVPLPKFPSIKRDIALLVPENVAAGELATAITSLNQKLVESAELFDVYRGKPIEEGYKSVALSVTYRSATKTLEDKSIDHVHKKIVTSLMNQFNARYREGSEA